MSALGRVKVLSKTAEITGYVLESLVYMHAAVDPDSGHLICHYNPLGVASLEYDGRVYPAVVIGGCMYLVPGRIGGSLNEVSVDVIEGDKVYVGGAVVEAYQLALLYNLAREGQASIRFYELELEDDRGLNRVILASVKMQQGDEYSVILSRCKDSRVRGEDSMYY